MKYCFVCGKKLRIDKEQIVGYNAEQGSPYYKAKVRCPDSHWWNEHLDTWGYSVDGGSFTFKWFYPCKVKEARSMLEEEK